MADDTELEEDVSLGDIEQEDEDDMLAKSGLPEKKKPDPYIRQTLEIGKRIAKLRNAAGHQQIDLAGLLSKHEDTKCSRATVSHWERGSILPSISHIWHIAEIYHVSPMYIILGTSAEDASPAILEHCRINEAGELEAVSKTSIGRDSIAADFVGNPESLISTDFNFESSELGTVNRLIIDPRDDKPAAREAQYLYKTASGEPQIAFMRKVADKDDRERINVRWDKMALDEVVFLDETAIIGRVVMFKGTAVH